MTRLEGLHPPLAHEAHWLAGVDTALVAAWLDHLKGLAPVARRQLHNGAAFLRPRVEQRQPPKGRKQRRMQACPECGNAQGFTAAGECVVCAGLVRLLGQPKLRVNYN